MIAGVVTEGKRDFPIFEAILHASMIFIWPLEWQPALIRCGAFVARLNGLPWRWKPSV